MRDDAIQQQPDQLAAGLPAVSRPNPSCERND